MPMLYYIQYNNLPYKYITVYNFQYTIKPHIPTTNNITCIYVFKQNEIPQTEIITENVPKVVVPSTESRETIKKGRVSR